MRRLLLLLHAPSADLIFIHREATPAGPPVIEWWLSAVLRKKIIYDFDDAIWTTDNTSESRLTKAVRWRSKVRSICKWSYRISCGNQYLAEYARQFNPNVVVNPTTIDATHMHFPVSASPGIPGKTVIGWTGSHSTLKYLEPILPVLDVLEKKYHEIEVLVIADKNPQLPLKSFRFEPWNHQSEIETLRHVDIGIMPLPDDDWAKGKCGFKALQYMALEIPAVVSPVGVNTEIVTDGLEGFWCSDSSEWLARLEELIVNPERRKKMGKRGREKVIARYSVTSNCANFLSLFQ